MKGLQSIFLLVAYLYGIQGQLTVPPSTAAILGNDVLLTCTSSEDSVFTWTYVTEAQPLYTGSTRATSLPRYDNIVLQGGTDAQTSILNISAIEWEDEGDYRCSTTSQTTDPPITTVTIEVAHTISSDVADELMNGTMYEATCEARNGRPEVTITWMLDDSGSPCSNTVETDLPADPPDPYLSGTRSVCTFQALAENNGKTLRCIISGHQVDGLNGEETDTLNILSAPADTGVIIVRLYPEELNLNVSCDINTEANPVLPNPMMMNYYITSNGTLIHQSDEGVNFRVVARPNFATDFVCVAGNDFGNTTSPVATYDPTSPTTLPTPTDLMTPPGPNDDRNNTGPPSGPGGLSDGAIAGIAIGAVLLIVIIILIIYFVCIRGTCSGNPGPSGASSTKKHGSSTVGTSNGSEKDKIKPVAAPRDQGSIQHTTDNPGQAEYAMVDRKKPGGGDMPDTRGPGQKEPQGMLYADLDLSASAGHTEKKVPQNKDDVVVYSSILV